MQVFHNLHNSLYFPTRDKSRKTLFKLVALIDSTITINTILQESHDVKFFSVSAHGNELSTPATALIIYHSTVMVTNLLTR